MGYQEVLIKTKSEKDALNKINKLKKIQDKNFVSIGNVVVKSRINTTFKSKNNILQGDAFILLLGDRHSVCNLANTIANSKDIYFIDDIIFPLISQSEYSTPKQMYEHCFTDIPIGKIEDLSEER